MPTRLHVNDIYMVLWAAAFQAWIRGFDYSTGGEAGQVSSLAVVEQVLPLPAWGMVFLAGAVLLAGGIMLRRHAVVWTGHLILWLAYLALATGLAAQAFGRPPFFDGLRNATVLIVLIALHFLTWFRMGPNPKATMRPVPEITARLRGDGD